MWAVITLEFDFLQSVSLLFRGHNVRLIPPYLLSTWDQILSRDLRDSNNQRKKKTQTYYFRKRDKRKVSQDAVKIVAIHLAAVSSFV